MSGAGSKLNLLLAVLLSCPSYTSLHPALIAQQSVTALICRSSKEDSCIAACSQQCQRSPPRPGAIVRPPSHPHCHEHPTANAPRSERSKELRQ